MWNFIENPFFALPRWFDKYFATNNELGKCNIRRFVENVLILSKGNIFSFDNSRLSNFSATFFRTKNFSWEKNRIFLFFIFFVCETTHLPTDAMRRSNSIGKLIFQIQNGVQILIGFVPNLAELHWTLSLYDCTGCRL